MSNRLIHEKSPYLLQHAHNPVDWHPWSDEADLWESILRLSPEGNFFDEATRQRTGTNIIHLTAPLEKWADNLGLEAEGLIQNWDRTRNKLYQARERRVQPLTDDKILTDWNGLMIAALALGARVLDKPEYASAAEKAAQFILGHMRDEKGQLFHHDF